MRRLIAVLVAALVVAGVLGGAGALPARAETTITAATVENGYPRNLTFTLSARSDSEITDVSLHYAIAGRRTSALGKPDEFTPGTRVDTKVTVQVNSAAGYIPVGSAFRWHWEVLTADGATTSQPEQEFFYLPPGQAWESVEGEFMAVYYHGNQRALATEYLEAGEATYQKVGQDLFNITLQQVPINVILFANEREMDPARPGAGAGSFDAAVTTCGTKVSNDIVLVIPQSCGTTDRTDTLRHELGHILNQTAGEGSLGKLPSWLDEGTAVYAQSTPGNGYLGAFQSAARRNQLIPFAQMGTPSGDASKVNLFYGQSYAMVRYLIDKGGPPQYAEFFATIKRGSRFDEALKQVYGFDLAGFEEEFRAAAGSAPSANPTAAPTQRPQQQQPTAAPTARPQQRQPTPAPTAAPAASSDSDDDGFDRTVLGLVGASVLFALVAVFFYLVSMMMGANRKRMGAGPGGPEGPGGA
jgi:hypothetical protein